MISAKDLFFEIRADQEDQTDPREIVVTNSCENQE